MKVARRRQTADEIRRLAGELDDWFAARKAEDRHPDGSERGQYRSQLAAIHAETAGAARLLLADAEAVDPARPPGEVYERCASLERQTVWLWRVWHFFRDKFDQRRDDRYRPLLQAADEVVWSCFHPFFRASPPSGPGGPPPLPYVDADYSPSALRRDQKRALGSRDRELEVAREAFEELPVPLLEIPITAVGSPWALVLIGHETGHFIQPLVSDGFGYVGEFRDALAGAVADAGGDSGDRDAWGGWGEEVFADWYSILTMGPWAIWAIAQFEIGDRDFMLTRRRRYPSPLARLALLAALADHHRLGGAAMLARLGLDAGELAAGAAEAERDLGYLPRLVAAVTRALPGGLGDLHRRLLLRPDDFGDRGRVAAWAGFVGGRRPRVPERKLESARLAAAGSAQAWTEGVFEAAALPDDDELAALRRRSLEAMRAAAAPGVRSAPPPFAPSRSLAVEERGRRLRSILARAAAEEVG